MRHYVLQMVLPYLRRALFALAMVLGASGALFAGTPVTKFTGTPSTKDIDTHAFRLGTAAAPFGWSAEPSLRLRGTDVDIDGDLDTPGEGITTRVAAPSDEDAGAIATLNVRPYRTACGFPSTSRAPPATAPIL